MPLLINDTHRIIRKIEDNIPFAYARFNDGEMMGIERSGSVVARGDQKVSNSLRNKLIEAIQHRQKNYWIGKPCSTCFPQHYKLYRTYVETGYEYEVYAVQFCNNGMWDTVVSHISNALKKRNVHWISGDDQNLEKLDFSIKEHYKVPSREGWQEYKNIANLDNNFTDGDVIILSCGPMSRVLAYEWFKRRPECTFIDTGSLFDPITRNIWHNCHKGTLKHCKECNWNV